jgi:hypothetical protein
MPLGEDAGNLGPPEMLEHMAGIDKRRRIVFDHGEPLDARDPIDMGRRRHVDMDEAGDVTLAAAEMELERRGRLARGLRAPWMKIEDEGGSLSLHAISCH